jgi:ATP-dependent 26S proteasome regulatory subunit
VSFYDDLNNAIRARYALIQLVTSEETRALSDLARMASELNHTLLIWTATEGVKIGDKVVGEKTPDLRAAIDFCEERARTGEALIFVFVDAESFLGRNSPPIYRRRMKELAQAIRNRGYHANCFLLGPAPQPPEDLVKDVCLFDYPLPDREQLKDLINQFVTDKASDERLKIDRSDVTLDALVEASLGLTTAETENCLARALVSTRAIDSGSVSAILDEKRQIVRKSGILEYVGTNELDLASVGGLDTLKRWLALRATAFGQQARQFGLAAPKGVLLTGIPGCGKSLTAKCISAAWRLPLLRLDIGKVFQGIVGSSEANLRQALKTAESIAPSVLWIDEIEKGLSGSSGGGDGGTSARVFGTLLTWMQDKTAPVFVIATANDISGLPPELLRKGRFDEIFFVDLPTEGERRAILDIHLARRGRKDHDLDLTRLAALSGEDQFGTDVRLTGAELEAWVNDALLEQWQRHLASGESRLTIADFETSLARMVPMAKMRAADIVALRRWASENAIAATVMPPTQEIPTATPIIFQNVGGRVLDF